MPDLRKRRLKLYRARPPRPLPPLAVQVLYLQQLRVMLARARALVHARLIPLLPDLVATAKEQRGDALHLDANPGRRVNKVMDGISAALYRKFPHDRLQRLGEKVAAATSDHQREQLLRQVKATLGVDLSTIADRKLRPRINQFVAENVALIKSVPQQYFDDVEKRVTAGMRAGLRHTEIADQLEERFGIAENRAKLIARDQVLKFNGELNRVRQEGLGISRYVWRTVEDNRVRPDHEERDGQIYDWDDPPGDPSDPATGGHPGTAINCRCYAEGVFSDLLDDE